MGWINALLDPGTLSLVIPIIIIVVIFVVAALKAHHKHQERIEKIKHGFDPDN
jgi:preprotein translocase subunit YajC